MLCTWIKFIGCTHVDRFVQKTSILMIFYCKVYMLWTILLYCSWEFSASTCYSSVKFTSHSVTLVRNDSQLFDVLSKSVLSEMWSFFQIILVGGCWNVKEAMSFVSLERGMICALVRMRSQDICAVMFAAVCVEVLVLVQTVRVTQGSFTSQHRHNCKFVFNWPYLSSIYGLKFEIIWSLWADTITGYEGSQYPNDVVSFQSKIWFESMIIVVGPIFRIHERYQYVWKKYLSKHCVFKYYKVTPVDEIDYCNSIITLHKVMCYLWVNNQCISISGWAMHNLCNQTPSFQMIHTALNKITVSGPQTIDIHQDKCPTQISSLGKYLIFPDLLQFDTLSNLISGCRLLGTCHDSIDNKYAFQ